MKTTQLLALITITAAFSSLSYGNTATLTFLDDLPAGTLFSEVQGVSADGSVVVGSNFVYGPFPALLRPRAFRWKRDTGVGELGAPATGASASQASSVSADGSVVVGFMGERASSAQQEAFRWSSADGFVGLGTLGGGNTSSRAWGVSADGSVIVGSSTSSRMGSSDEEAFLWTSQDGMIGLGDLPGGSYSSRATAVSADGSVVVGRSDGALAYEQPFRWTKNEGMIQLGNFPVGGYATAISANGRVIVGGRNPVAVSGYLQEAFLWTSEGGIIDLGDLPGTNFISVAHAVSADGSIVVGSSMGYHGYEPFIWDANHGMRRLRDVLVNDYGLQLHDMELLGAATGISDDGRTIVGANNSFPWIVTLPIPEPNSLVLVALSFMGISVRWRIDCH